MRGDRERCLDAGMSAYLPKPVRGSDLEETLRRWLQPGAAGDRIAAAAPAPAAMLRASPGPDREHRPSALAADPGGPQAKALANPAGQADRDAAPIPRLPEGRGAGTEPVLDLEEVTKAQAAMRDRFKTMIEYFLEDVSAHLATIEDGLEVGDLGRVVRPAHNIRSAAGQMGAVQLARLAGELETAARTALDQGTSRVDPARRIAMLALLRATFEQTRTALERLERPPPASAA
jgi:HPt (histidine-containing phosphotransfer) domain-containing protein